MVDMDTTNERGLSAVDRLTEPNANDTPAVDLKRDRKLDDKEALSILFVVALLPSFIVPAGMILETQECVRNWLTAFVVIICFSALFNYITLNILNRVASVKQMDSYQEVAYNISNSNRGYIFLISAAKFIFLAITASFAVDYCASYLTQISLMGRVVSPDDIAAGEEPMKPERIFGVYFSWVCVVAIALYVPFYMLRDDKNCEGGGRVVTYAYVFAACFLVQYLIFLGTIIAAVSHTSRKSIEDSFLFDQLEKMGWRYIPPPRLQPQSSNDTAEMTCDQNQIIIGYIPALFYSNMFSLCFLEIKSLTKISQDKSSKDHKIGLKVVLTVFISYLLIFLTLLFGSLASGDNFGDDENFKPQFLIAVLNQFIAVPSPFTMKRSQFTFFEANYILTFAMMVTQALVLLHLARENLKIFAHEHVNQQLSKSLDWKNRGMDTKNKQRGARSAEQQSNGPSAGGRGVGGGKDLDLTQSDHGSSQQQPLIPNSKDEGSRLGTAVQGGNASSSQDQGNNYKRINENRLAAIMYATVILFALFHCKANNILAHLWVVVASIVCPLLDLFIPGIFYFRVMKEEEDEEDERNKTCSKVKRCMARFYTFLGALFLPLLLTLSTKALFSVPES